MRMRYALDNGTTVVRIALLALMILPGMLHAADSSTPINYGPEWESILREYNSLCEGFQQQRQQLLADPTLTPEQRVQRIQQHYDSFTSRSRQLAARRSEIVAIAAERSGVKVSLGSDPAKGRGMAGDIDLAGTRQQAEVFVKELRNLGIADAFDIKMIESTPGYVTIKGPMEVTINYDGKLGQIGSSAYETQIYTDARSAETYNSVAMGENQVGRKPVETLDHLRKARKALATAPEVLLKQPEALQTACKGTLKAIETIGMTDLEIDVILKKSGLNMTADKFRSTLDSIRKGTNIAPELANLGEHNARAFYDALDDAARTCQNKAIGAFEMEIRQARGIEMTLRQSNDPAIRAQIPEARAEIIDSTLRMRENLNGLVEMDEKALNNRKQQLANSADIAARSENVGVTTQTRERLNRFTDRMNGVQAQNQRMKLWMNGIEQGVGRVPAGATIFGTSKQFTMPGAETLNKIVDKSISGYQAFRNNETVAKYMGNTMQAAGGLMMAQSWYLSSLEQGDSEAVAAGKGVAAGLMSLTTYGSLALGVSDLKYHWTTKAESYRQDQNMRYAMMGMNIKDETVQEHINARVNIRRGAYTIVKGTSYGSIFYAHPAAIIAGATLEAGLAVYEAYEDAELWKMYAVELEKFNDAMQEQDYERGTWFAEQVASSIKARADFLNRSSQCYTELMKERDSLAQMRQTFLADNEKYQDYLRSLIHQAEQAQGSANLDVTGTQALLTRLKQIVSQAQQAASHARNTAQSAQKNPDSLAGARSVLSTLSSEYDALKRLLEAERPNVARCGLLRRDATGTSDSPVDMIRSYRDEMARLETHLKPRYESTGNLMNMNNELGPMINSTAEQQETYLPRIKRYEGFLAGRPEAASCYARVQAARATLEAIKLPAWRANYVDNLQRHYINVRDIYDAARRTLTLIDGVYPEPLSSMYTDVDPEVLTRCEQIEEQWSQAGRAMSEFYAQLVRLASLIGVEHAVAKENEPVEPSAGEVEQEYPDEALASFGNQSRDELMAEIARLEALKAELRSRADKAVADLNTAFFADRDSLWKAYEAAFKTPRMMACDNCKTETLHSMDYSDSPPSVWCNSCGAIYSFGRWAGAGSSLDQIRERGRAKKQAILDQLDTNIRSIDKAISQAREAASGK